MLTSQYFHNLSSWKVRRVFFAFFSDYTVVVNDFDHCLLKQIANSLDLGDFRQLILYFGLST